MNNFLTINDDKLLELDGFKVPAEWWSRPYEYGFCKLFLNEDRTILDAGCGIEHPFKNYAAKRSKKTFAIDIDSRINEYRCTDKITFINDDLINFQHDLKNKIDTIFCVSVLEHININLIPFILNNFRKYLVENGQIVLTCDWPTICYNRLAELAVDAGFVLLGNINYIDNDNINICYPYYPLKVFTMVLVLSDESKKLIEEDKKYFSNKNEEKTKSKKMKKKEKTSDE